MRPLFSFGAQVGIFVMGSERFLALQGLRRGCKVPGPKRSKDIDGTDIVSSVVQLQYKSAQKSKNNITCYNSSTRVVVFHHFGEYYDAFVHFLPNVINVINVVYVREKACTC